MDGCRSEILEELWRIKDEMSSRYNSFTEYFDDLLRRQDEVRRQGFQFVDLSSGTLKFVTS